MVSLACVWSLRILEGAMTQITNRRAIPKSVRQKQILDVAEANPDASLEEIADEVPGTTAAVVEQVLDEYGDPAVDDSDADPTSTGDESDTEVRSDESADDVAGSTVDSTPPADDTGEETSDVGSPSGGETPDEISPKDEPVEKQSESIGESVLEERPPANLTDFPNRQRELLESIYEHPEATQRELAAHLDVSRTTVYNRVRNIDGLEWNDRHRFVDAVFNGGVDRADIESDAGEAKSDSGDDDREIAARNVDDGGHDTERSRYDTGGGTANSSRGDVEITNGAAINGTDSSVGIGDLIERVEAVESHLDDLVAKSESDGLSTDPELVHKIAHACLYSDTISEEEELQILRNLLE